MPSKPRFDRDRILNLWSQGLTKRQICLRLGLSPTTATVPRILKEAREQKDPRVLKGDTFDRENFEL